MLKSQSETITTTQAATTIDVTPETLLTSSSRKKTTKNLFGSLGVAGRPWIIVNIGLLVVGCRGCDQRTFIDEFVTIKVLREIVEIFSEEHRFCGK